MNKVSKKKSTGSKSATKKATTKKTTKKIVAKKSAPTKSVKTKSVKPVKKNNNNLKLAFYIVFVIVILLILYFVNFKKPKNELVSNGNVINELITSTTSNYGAGSKNTIPLNNNFKVYKQSKNDTSGPACIMTILSLYNSDSIFTEKSVEEMKSAHDFLHGGTCINQMCEIFTTMNVKFVDNSNYKLIPEFANLPIGLELINKCIKMGYPMIVGWNERPGQWIVIVGYDNMGTNDTKDDLLIIANPDNKSKDKNLTSINALNFSKKWSFGDYFNNEPSAAAKSKYPFLILRGYN